MDRRLYLVIGFVALLIATAALIAGAIYLINKDTGLLASEEVVRPKILPPPPLPPEPEPEVTIYKGGTEKKPTLIVSWKNLHADTIRINIFRSRNSSKWSMWKIINVGGQTAGGAVEIAIPRGEYTYTYSYYTETVSRSGEVSWTSPQSEPSASPPPPDLQLSPTSTVTVANPPPTPTSTVPAPSPTSTPTAPQPTSTATTTAPAPPPPPPPPPAQTTTTVTYYTPQSTVSGYTTPQSANFWVRHVNQYIEIGWQNLPAGTDRVIVFRSANETGPWTNLLEQNNPVITGPYVIRIVDETLTASYYYRLEARTGTQVLQSYGPAFLEQLAP